MPLRVLDLPGLDRYGPGLDRYGPALTLVRPDQYVAWAGDRGPGDASALVDRIRGAL